MAGIVEGVAAIGETLFGGAEVAGTIAGADALGSLGGAGFLGAETGAMAAGTLGSAEALAGLGGAGFLGATDLGAGIDAFGFGGMGNFTTSVGDLSVVGSGGLGDILGTLGGASGSTLAQIANVGSGLYGLNQSRKMRGAMAPFDKYRGAYGQQLQALEKNPASITSRPGYQAGLQVVQRGQAAGGYLGSGNEMAALSKYGGDFYAQETARLANLAGAGAAPGAGYPASMDLAGRSLASIGYGLAPGSTPQNNQLQQLLRLIGRP
jgi:hypothetical protein